MSHTVQIQNKWYFQIWDESQINLKSSNLLKEIDALNRDLKLTPKIYQNIITQKGLEEIAKRSIESTTKTYNKYHAIGTGTTEETQADETMETEVSRKAIQTATAFSNTERYATAYNHDGTNDYDITEAGILTAETGGILIAHVTTQSPSEIRSGKTLTVATTVSHEYEEPE